VIGTVIGVEGELGVDGTETGDPVGIATGIVIGAVGVGPIGIVTGIEGVEGADGTMIGTASGVEGEATGDPMGLPTGT
jgi:hypothetical protein